MRAWELCSTGFTTLSTAPVRYDMCSIPEYRIKNMTGRRITPLTGFERDRGSSPPCSRRFFNSDHSLLRVNLPVALSNEDVWHGLKIPGNGPLLDHIWYPFLLFREA